MAKKTKKQEVLVSYDFLPIFETLIKKGKTLAASELTVAIIRYDMDGTDPEFTDESVGFVWETVIKPKLDANKEAYEEVAKVRREAVAKRYVQNEQMNTNDTNEYKCTDNEQMNTFATDNDNDNDNDYVNDNDLKEKINKKEKPPKHKYGQYKNVLLSDEELTKLQTEFPFDWQERIENVSAYCASHGKTYRDYLATIRNWARKDSKPNPKNDVNAGYEQAMKLLGGSP